MSYPSRPAAPKKGRPSGGALGTSPAMPGLAEVLIRDLREIKHGDLILAIEQRTELLVGVDGPPVLRILQPVPLDVCPQLADDLCAGHGAVADDGGELCAGLQRSHECGIRSALLP